MALKLLFDKGHLQVTMADTENLINTNRETWDHQQLMAAVLATIQTSYPGCEDNP